MIQCNLHFDDSTAHATVEWFLSRLSCDNILIEAENFDNLCKDLNSVHFIDCLRNQVKEDRDIFENIKNIVEELEGTEDEKLKRTEKWRRFPNLSILLLSISRESLERRENASVKERLLRVVKKIYDYNTEDRYLVFRAGCQLLRFEDDEWKSEFAKFRRLHSEEISKFRMLYYWTDNPAVFIHRVFERWRRDNESIAEDFKTLEAYRDLNPLRFELPVQARSAEAFKFASDSVNFLEDTQEDNEKIRTDFLKNLATQFRIIQWEVLVRNLVEETIENRYCFHPMSIEYNIPGMPDEDFLGKFINNTRNVECRFEPSDGEIPTQQRDYKHSLSTEKTSLDDNKAKEVTKCHESFKILLNEMPNDYFFVHEDLVNSFGNIRTSDKSSDKLANAMLIEDGELSFFSLLWFLRYARYEVEHKKSIHWESRLEKWKSDPKEKLTIRFRLEKDPPEPFKVSWSECNIYDFAEECGLIIRLSESECIPTRRWSSLIAWLRRLNDDLGVKPETDHDKEEFRKFRKSKTLKHNNPLIERLPIKILDHGEHRTVFIQKLWMFLASDDLEKKLNELDKTLSDASTFDKKFAEELGELIELLDNHSLLKAKSSVGLEDMVLLRCCRGFIPIEHLIRAYKPCEFHLLFQALNWEKSYHGHKSQAPISIGCATIAGRVEVESSQTSAINFDNWLIPYRSLFYSLSADFTLPEVKGASEQIGEQTGAQDQQTNFAHQTSGLIGTIWIDPNKKKLSLQSQFSLWLASVQVTQIWGDIEMNPDQKIFRDIPEWAGFNAMRVLTELVYLGLWGGIVRAMRTPEADDRLSLAMYAREKRAVLDEPDSEGKIRQVLEVERRKLFCDFPTDLPDWVTTQAFAICFYHGMRQAVYHALESFVLDNTQKESEKRYLWIEWDDKEQAMSIYNRARVNEEQQPMNLSSKDSEFFARFSEKAIEKGSKQQIYKINGPELVNSEIHGDRWRVKIRRVVGYDQEDV